jgi:hypothetical protein
MQERRVYGEKAHPTRAALMTAEAVVQPKKTGRPKGSRNAPPGLRAARWAVRHLADEGAVPPTALAARMLAMAREEPDRFALYLDQAEMQVRPARVERAASAAQAVAGLPGESSRSRGTAGCGT